MIVWPGGEGYNYPFQVPYAESWSRLIDGIGEVARALRAARAPALPRAQELRAGDEDPHVEHRDDAPRDPQAARPRHRQRQGQHGLAAPDHERRAPAEYAALLAAEGLLGHQHANSGWGTFDDDNMVGATAFMETLELALELRRANYGANGERLGFDLYPYTEDQVAAVKRSVLQWRFIDEVAATHRRGRAARGAVAQGRGARLRARVRGARRVTDGLVGLDVGTTGVKAIAIDAATARSSRVAEESYPLSTPQPGWAEQDPDDWWRAPQAALAAPPEAAASGFSGQMHGLVVARRRRARRCGRRSSGTTSARQPSAPRSSERIGLDAADRADRQPRAHRLHRAEAAVAAHARAATSSRASARAAAEGLRAPEALRASTRSTSPTRPARCSSTSRTAAGATRCSQRSSCRASGCRPRTSRRAIAGRGRPGRRSARRRRRRAGPLSVVLGTSGVVFGRCRAFSADREGARARVLPRRARDVARDGRDAVRGGLAALAAGRGRARRRRRWSPRPRRGRPAPRGCSSRRTSRASARRMPTRTPAARSSGSPLRHDRGALARAVLEGVAYGLRDSLELLRELGVEPRRRSRLRRRRAQRSVAADRRLRARPPARDDRGRRGLGVRRRAPRRRALGAVRGCARRGRGLRPRARTRRAGSVVAPGVRRGLRALPRALPGSAPVQLSTALASPPNAGTGRGPARTPTLVRPSCANVRRPIHNTCIRVVSRANGTCPFRGRSSSDHVLRLCPFRGRSWSDHVVGLQLLGRRSATESTIRDGRNGKRSASSRFVDAGEHEHGVHPGLEPGRRRRCPCGRRPSPTSPSARRSRSAPSASSRGSAFRRSTGATSVARLISAATEPVAGSGPSGVGPVGSGLVAMKRAPATISRIACEIRSKL